MRMLAVIFFAGLSLVGCRGKPDGAADVTDDHTSENALDWTGRYKGTLPCENCDRIEADIELRENKTYQARLVFAGEHPDTVIHEDAFEWDQAGSTIRLKKLPKINNTFFVGENQLVQLNKAGDRPALEFVKEYTLTKQ